MGFRIGILFVSTREPGFFGTNPKLIESRIPRVCGMLGISKARRIESFDNMVYTFNPRDKQFALGVYDGAFYYSAEEILNGNLLEIYESKKNKILQDYPDAEALVIQVYDTVNLFGYALYRGANLVRAYGGNGDDDVTVERGELQPEEKPFFSKSWVVFGKRGSVNSFV